MAVNLINSNDIEVIQNGDNIKLETPTHISDIVGDIGDLTELDTTDKTNLVGAINEIEAGNVYSTSEINTGKIWIDGKPIYRKVINLGSWTSNSSGNNDKTIAQINYDTVIELNLYVKYGDAWYNKWDTFNNILINDTTTLRFNISTSITFADSFVIIEYTKSS